MVSELPGVMLPKAVQLCGDVLPTFLAEISTNWNADPGGTGVIGIGQLLCNECHAFPQVFRRAKVGFLHRVGPPGAQSLGKNVVTDAETLAARLAGRRLTRIDYKLVEVSRWKLERPDPTEMIKLFFYGDRIYWGDRREEYEKLKAEPDKLNEYEFQYLVASGEMALFYMGYAWLIEQMVLAARVRA
ncbi:hypothetical protein [Nesterenkonia ebinurensis]|uniref:hypothetical protein n=1 Tax=Nesterenkonia ebinurensis TaxID=2608252 RepID=UPI00123E0E3C|nr:hypothetical protein [Nesterenkonia ebinurensis]